MAFEAVHAYGVEAVTSETEVGGGFVLRGGRCHVTVDAAHKAVVGIALAQALGLITLHHQKIHVRASHEGGFLNALITPGFGQKLR